MKQILQQADTAPCWKRKINMGMDLLVVRHSGDFKYLAKD